MASPNKTREARRDGDYEVRVVGAPPLPLRDFYHRLLRLSWTRTLGLVVLGYTAINFVFALLFLATGGIANARAGSLWDAFYFSVQTMGTIGYGAMYPASHAANVLVVVESTLGLVLTALVTGLVFAKFSRPTARLLFSRRATIAPMNGVPTLSFRLGNQRENLISEAQIRVALVRTDHTDEGHTFYRMLDLKLVRERALSLSRAFTVLHAIDEDSPLFGETPTSCFGNDTELLISVTGMDDIWMQTVQAQHRYLAAEIAWGYRPVDILSDDGDVMTLDLTRFHDIEPSAPIDRFPYPEDEVSGP